ncbi:acyl-CoA dehydrogenase family protein [bacterium]|nr:acyl-CoA dehydrogenase family protein [bacterium]
MDFSIDSQTRDLLARVRAFVDEDLIPFETRAFAGTENPLRLLDEKRERVKELGLWAPPHPKEHGGMGLGLVTHGLVSEELGRTPLGHYVFGCQAPDAANVEILHTFGTDEQKARWLGPLVAGEIRSSFGMTEPENPGSNPTMLSTTAVADGDDWVINGRKWFTTGADGSAFCVVMAITHPDAPIYTRASMILVPTDTRGYRLVRNIPVMGHAGGGPFSHGEVEFENCRVPRTNTLGGEAFGFAIAQERLGPGRIHHCMRWLGICKRAYEMMCAYAAKRPIHPDGRPLGTKGMVQGWIAESAAEIEAARWMVLHAAWKIEQIGQKEARDEVSLIKFHVANVLQRVVDRAIQVHGGLGVTDDTILAHWYRHERAARIYDGADEVHKESFARRTLRRYGMAK